MKRRKFKKRYIEKLEEEKKKTKNEREENEEKWKQIIKLCNITWQRKLPEIKKDFRKRQKRKKKKKVMIKI